MRFVLDATWRRAGPDRRVVLGGSPLRLFRLSAAGARIADEIEAGADTSSPLAERWLDAGAIHPAPATSFDAAHTFGVGDLTVVTPQLGGSVARDGRITVDDGSTPPLDTATVRLPTNRGPAAARNAGRPHCTTPLIAFVDADVDLPAAAHTEPSAWWAPLLAHFDDERVGLVAPRVTGDDGSSLDLGAAPARVRAGTRVSYVPGAMLIVRADAFDAIGGFDEALRSGEDVDFVWRLDADGWRCRYEPTRTVDHRPRPSLIGQLRQQINYGASSGPLALRHPRALAPYRSNAWTAAVWLLAAAGRPVTSLAVAVGSTALLARRLRGVEPAVASKMVVSGHVRAGGQAAAAIRRAWWPLALGASLVSRRARRVAIIAFLVDLRRPHIDLAFGWGLWRSMLRHRTLGPIRPDITSGP